MVDWSAEVGEKANGEYFLKDTLRKIQILQSYSLSFRSVVIFNQTVAVEYCLLLLSVGFIWISGTQSSGMHGRE